MHLAHLRLLATRALSGCRQRPASLARQGLRRSHSRPHPRPLTTRARAVGSIARSIDAPQSTVSKNISGEILFNAGLVGRRREASTVIYSIASPDIGERLRLARLAVIVDNAAPAVRDKIDSPCSPRNHPRNTAEIRLVMIALLISKRDTVAIEQVSGVASPAPSFSDAGPRKRGGWQTRLRRRPLAAIYGARARTGTADRPAARTRPCRAADSVEAGELDEVDLDWSGALSRSRRPA